jgi:hypothetical protein
LASSKTQPAAATESSPAGAFNRCGGTTAKTSPLWSLGHVSHALVRGLARSCPKPLAASGGTVLSVEEQQHEPHASPRNPEDDEDDDDDDEEEEDPADEPPVVREPDQD